MEKACFAADNAICNYLSIVFVSTGDDGVADVDLDCELRLILYKGGEVYKNQNGLKGMICLNSNLDIPHSLAMRYI